MPSAPSWMILSVLVLAIVLCAWFLNDLREQLSDL
jgi:hypothetical protein